MGLPTLLLPWIRRSIAMAIPPVVGDHIEVRVCATVFRVRSANLKHSGWVARFIHQMVTIGITTPERSAVASAQELLACVGYQRQLTTEHPDEFVLMAMPVT